MHSSDTAPVNLFEFEALARKSLEPVDYDFIAGGATDEITLRRSREAFEALLLCPRVLRDVSDLRLDTSVLGRKIAFPVMIAPAGSHTRAHPDGELATCRATSTLDTLMVVSTASSYTLEDVAAATSGPLWFQTYVYRDREITRAMVTRAEAAGYLAICLTVDRVTRAKRERNLRNRYVSPIAPNYDHPWIRELLGDQESTKDLDLVNPAATWDDLRWLAGFSPLPVVVKGVLSESDAELAIDNGASGLIVSTHGGRQLDTTLTSIEALPKITRLVGGKIEIYLDSGIRRGTDVLKAIALGARSVLVGRPTYWGLAYDGETGVRSVLQLLRDEFSDAMMACGYASVDEIGPEILAKSCLTSY